MKFKYNNLQSILINPKINELNSIKNYNKKSKQINSQNKNEN